MIEAAPTSVSRTLGGASLFGLVVFLGLWFANRPFRTAYQPTDNDVTALADGLLLLPGAHWQDWFTHGHSHFFDPYPEWPQNLTGFARPAFQSMIFLAHYVFDRDWASYLAINYLGVACIGAVAFAIARFVLALSGAAAALAAALVVTSPSVLEFSIWQVGFASESFATVFVGCAFLAVVARRDFICLVCLFIAILTKETALWAPIAAGLTAFFRTKDEEGGRGRWVAAIMLLLPLAIWGGFRFALFEGVDGTYATADYWPFAGFLKLAAWKLSYVHHLFLQQHPIPIEGGAALADRAVRGATAAAVLVLLLVWALVVIGSMAPEIRKAIRERRRPRFGAASLTALWAMGALAFYFVLALQSTRYAASAPLFVWPAVVQAIVRTRVLILRVGIVACLVLSLVRTSYLLAEWNPPPSQSDVAQFFRDASAMNTALREVPAAIREVYVITGGALVTATPAYLRAYLEVPAELNRLVDVRSKCGSMIPFVRVQHSLADGWVTLRAELPPCASFYFDLAGPASTAIVDGGLRRNDRVTYELPDAHAVEHKGPFEPAIDLGQHVIMHVRPRGPARFIFEPSSPTGGLAWFDTP